MALPARPPAVPVPELLALEAVPGGTSSTVSVAGSVLERPPQALTAIASTVTARIRFIFISVPRFGTRLRSIWIGRGRQHIKINRLQALIRFYLIILPEWRPDRFPHVAAGGGEPLLHRAVHGDRGQHAPLALPRGIDQRGAVGREIRRLVQPAIGQHLEQIVLQVVHRDAEIAPVVVDDRELAAVRRYPRARIIAALEGHATGIAAVDVDPVDLRPAAAVRGEIDGFAVRRPGGLGVDGRVGGQPSLLAAGHRQDPDIRVAVGTRERQRDAPAVRRPGRRAVDALLAGQPLAVAGPQGLHPHGRTVALEGDVGDAAPVRRPAGRHERLGRLDDGVLVGAVRIRDDQTIGPLGGILALGGDVGDAGGEHPGYAGDLFVDHIRRPVRGKPQAPFRGRHAVTHELLAAQNVEQLELDGVVVLGLADQAPDHYQVGAHHAPVVEIDLDAAGGPRQHVAPLQRLEATAAGQIRADHGRDVQRRLAGAVPAEGHHRHGHCLAGALGDLDGQFGPGQSGTGHQRDQNQRSFHFVCSKRRASASGRAPSPLLFRSERESQVALEQAAVGRRRQRRGLHDCRLDGAAHRRIRIALAEAHVDDVATRQLGHEHLALDARARRRRLDPVTLHRLPDHGDVLVQQPGLHRAAAFLLRLHQALQLGLALRLPARLLRFAPLALLLLAPALGLLLLALDLGEPGLLGLALEPDPLQALPLLPGRLLLGSLAGGLLGQSLLLQLTLSFGLGRLLLRLLAFPTSLLQPLLLLLALAPPRPARAAAAVRPRGRGAPVPRPPPARASAHGWPPRPPPWPSAPPAGADCAAGENRRPRATLPARLRAAVTIPPAESGSRAKSGLPLLSRRDSRPADP